MDQFLFKRGASAETGLFPHIIEFGVKKNNAILLNSMPEQISSCFHIYYVMEGKFEFIIQDSHSTLYPGDMALILPGHKFSGNNGILNIGTIAWMHLQLDKFDITGKMATGKWSTLPKNDCMAIGKTFVMAKIISPIKLNDAGRIFQQTHGEIVNQEIGFTSRVNGLIDELLIKISRQLVIQNISHRDFPQTFANLEQSLRENLAHQWTVEEMAAMVGLGSTSFTEKVKAYSGFSPLNYLINIRITEAIKKMKKTDLNITEIALATGFYSSQHFATTFKKLTGYTPSDFRTRDLK